MRVLTKRLVFFSIGFFFLPSSVSYGQIFRAAGAVHNEDMFENGFQVSQAIHIDFGGMRTVTSFSISDENGIGYDMMSLLRNQNVRKQADVSDQMFREMNRDYGQAVAKMRSQVVKASLSSESHDQLEAEFMAMEAGLKEKLEPEQLASIENARHQLGFEKVGLKHFATEEAIEKFGISEELAKVLRDSKTQSELESFLNDVGNELTLRANAELLKKLTDDQQEKVKALLNEQSSEAYHEMDLFLGGRTIKTRKKNLARQVLKKLCSSTVRTSLKIDDEQEEKIGQLRVAQRDISDEDIEAQLAELLTKDQSEKLVAALLKKELAKVGTVNLLSFGILGQWLELTEAESQKIFESGEQLFETLKSESSSKLEARLRSVLRDDNNAGELSSTLAKMMSCERLID